MASFFESFKIQLDVLILLARIAKSARRLGNSLSAARPVATFSRRDINLEQAALTPWSECSRCQVRLLQPQKRPFHTPGTLVSTC